MSVWFALTVGLCCGLWLLIAVGFIVYPAVKIERDKKHGTRR